MSSLNAYLEHQLLLILYAYMSLNYIAMLYTGY